MHKRKPRLAIEHRANIKEMLASDGYARIDGADFALDVETRQALTSLIAGFDDLPTDPNDSTTMRRRRYGRFVYIPWVDALFEQPSVARADGDLVVEYFQPLSLNAVDGGKRRPFTPLHPVTRSNKALQELIRFDFWSLPEREEWEGMPITVGVHQIALCPLSGTTAISSPNHLHQDGEPFTYVHLMRRVNIAGGVNYVAGPQCVGIHPKDLHEDAILSHFTLERLLDSFVVDDRMVCHHVDEAYPLLQGQPAERAVFLIDFTPNVPQFG